MYYSLLEKDPNFITHPVHTQPVGDRSPAVGVHEGPYIRGEGWSTECSDSNTMQFQGVRAEEEGLLGA